MSEDIPTLLKNNKNKLVLLIMKEHRSIRGILLDFDVHMNLSLNDAEDISDSNCRKLGKILVRGDNIFVISIPEESSTKLEK